MGRHYRETGLRGRFAFGHLPRWFMRDKDGALVCRVHGREHLTACTWCYQPRCRACWGERRCDHCQHDINDPTRHERKRARIRRLRRLRRRVARNRA